MKTKLITLLFVMICGLCHAQNRTTLHKLATVNVQVYLYAGVFSDSVVHIVWENYDESNIKQVILESSTDGAGFNTLAKATVAGLLDIHVHDYPEWIDYNGHILLSSEHGNNRFIFNDVLHDKNLAGQTKWYRVKMITNSGSVFLTQTINIVNTNEEHSGVPDAAINSNINSSSDVNKTTLTCPPVSTPPTGTVSTGQIQTHSTACCNWTEELYNDTVSAIYTSCGGNSYAWCCSSVPGASGCTSGYVSDPCCVHYCNQYNSCSCHPWQCCTAGNVSHWVVTQSTNFSSMALSANTQNSSCSNANDGAITINVNNAVPPVAYLWSNGATVQNLINILPGTYTVTVTDSIGCAIDSTFIISATNIMTVTSSSQNAHCNLSDGYAAVTASGGTGNYTYLWNTVPPQTIDSIINIPAGIYTVTVSDGICSETRTITITNISAPSATIASITPAVCGTHTGAINANVSGGSSPYSYVWNSSPPQYVQDLVNAVPGYYCLTVTDAVNCQAIVCATITTTAFQAPPICIVSVDTASNHNIVVWEKPALMNGINQYYIYRETSQAGVYSMIGFQNAAMLSTFMDVSSIPLQQAYRYKLALFDSCGALSVQSPFHETIHLTASVGINNDINLIWNHYQGFTFSTYNIYRGNSLGTLTLLNSVSSNNNSYTDLNPPAGNLFYLIEALKPTACNPSKALSSSKSNILQLVVTGIAEENPDNYITVYLSSESGILTVNASQPTSVIEILNIEGQLIKRILANESQTTIDISSFAKGMYFVKVKTEKGIAVKKFVKE